MDNLNILAALAGALPRCRSLAWSGHVARPASCIAFRQHTHNCPNYLYQETPQSTQSVRAELVEAHRPFDKLRANGKMEVVTVRGVAGKDDP